jgi:predicted dehydrogenase
MDRREFIALTAAGLASTAFAAESKGKYRVALIGHTGQGDFGHGLDTMWEKLPQTELVAIADADAAGLAKAQKKLELKQGFADYRKMIAELKPDIVTVCPRQLHEHHDMLMAAIDGGARGIYMEKPFVRTPAEADEIVAACKARKTKLAIAHRNRYHPALATITQMIKDDAIGTLVEIRGRGKEDPRGGPVDLWVLGSHVLNLSTYFAGMPRACMAEFLQDGKPAIASDVVEGAEGLGPVCGNEVHARYETESGVPIFFDSVKGVGPVNFGLTLVGTKGMIVISVDNDPIAYFVRGRPYIGDGKPREWKAITTAGPGAPEPIAGLKDFVMGHTAAGQDLIESIEQNREPKCGATAAALTVEMICATFASHRAGNERVALPLASRQHPLAGWQ